MSEILALQAGVEAAVGIHDGFDGGLGAIVVRGQERHLEQCAAGAGDHQRVAALLVGGQATDGRDAIGGIEHEQAAERRVRNYGGQFYGV